MINVKAIVRIQSVFATFFPPGNVAKAKNQAIEGV